MLPGATRGPLKPAAPYEGLAYSAQPFFAWTPSPGAATYHLTLRDGSESSAPVIYEADVNEAQLIYPAKAPKLVPGKLYSWRVSMAGVMERKLGPPVTFFVLAGADAEQVKKALAQAKLNAPKTAADRLRQARIFAEYGVWYDALRIAGELIKENPGDADAKAFYDSLIQRLRDQTASAALQSHSSALALWLEVGHSRVVERKRRSCCDFKTQCAAAGYCIAIYFSKPLSQGSTENKRFRFLIGSEVVGESDRTNQGFETKIDEGPRKKPGVALRIL